MNFHKENSVKMPLCFKPPTRKNHQLEILIDKYLRIEFNDYYKDFKNDKASSNTNKKIFHTAISVPSAKETVIKSKPSDSALCLSCNSYFLSLIEWPIIKDLKYKIT